MIFFITYFITYFLSYLGYLLGNSTLEEHKEIQKYLKYAVDILLVVTYALLVYTFSRNAILLFLLAGLIAIKIASHFHKKYFLDLHNVGLFSVTLIFFHNNLYIDEVYITLLPLMVLILDNSMHSFNIKIESYKLLMALVLFLLLNVL